MSGWTHLCCEDCWRKRKPGREPVRAGLQSVAKRNGEPCCYCGELTSSGIYDRADPKQTDCQGHGVVHAGDDE